MSMSSEGLSQRLLMAIHRPPALRTPNAKPPTTNPEVQRPEPAQQPNPLESAGDGKARGAICPHVRFVLRRVQLLDVDAKFGAIKDLLDGLRYAGLIHGDKEGEITLSVDQERVGHYKDQETQIDITIP